LNPKTTLVPETGLEHLGNAEIWANIQHRLMSGCMGAFLFQIFALVFVDVSSIRIGRAFALDCLSGYRSGPQPRKRKRMYERETVTSCMAGSMRPQHATALQLEG
jgi:hypothetical protein